MIKINQKGTSIVELLVYMVLLAIFLLMLLNLFTTTLSFRLTSESISVLNQDMRYITSKISYDVYNADSINLPATLGSSGNTLQITKSGVTSTYSLDAQNNLSLNTAGVPMNLNGLDTKVSNISFKKIGVTGGKDTVQMILTLQSNIQESAAPRSMTMQAAFGLR